MRYHPTEEWTEYIDIKHLNKSSCISILNVHFNIGEDGLLTYIVDAAQFCHNPVEEEEIVRWHPHTRAA